MLRKLLPEKEKGKIESNCVDSFVGYLCLILRNMFLAGVRKTFQRQLFSVRVHEMGGRGDEKMITPMTSLTISVSWPWNRHRFVDS